MAAERGYYEINPEPSRNLDGPVLFRGSGDATLTVFGFENWKEFLSRGDRPLTEAEVERIEEAASIENFSVGGRIAVEWPDVELAFAMDDFVGEWCASLLSAPPLFYCSGTNRRLVAHQNSSGM